MSTDKTPINSLVAQGAMKRYGPITYAGGYLLTYLLIWPTR